MMRARLNLLLLAAFPGVASFAPPVSTFAPPRLLDGVPDVVQETDYSCGPSALVAVFAYFGILVDEAQIIREAKTDPAVGAEVEDLADVARRHGLAAEPREGLTLAVLERELRARRPVIALIQAHRGESNDCWEDDWEDGHYVVVIGIDARYVYVEDPVLDGQRGFIPRAEFVDRWHCWSFDLRRSWGQGVLFRGTPSPRGQRWLGLQRVE